MVVAESLAGIGCGAPRETGGRSPYSCSVDLMDPSLTARMKNALVVKDGNARLFLRDFLPASLHRKCFWRWPRYKAFTHATNTRARVTLAQLPNADMSSRDFTFWTDFFRLINETVKPALIETFRPHMDLKFAYLSEQDRAWARERAAFDCWAQHEGLNWDRRFSIGPHVDQQFIFVTSLLYLGPRFMTDEGTSFYKGPNGLTSLDTEFPDRALFTETERSPFIPNSLLSFIQTPTAFHGKEEVKRFRWRRSYQFNVHMSDRFLHELNQRTGKPGPQIGGVAMPGAMGDVGHVRGA